MSAACPDARLPDVERHAGEGEVQGRETLFGARVAGAAGAAVLVSGVALAGRVPPPDGARGLGGGFDACSDCHELAPARSHPLGIAPSSSTGLPLDERGHITCQTCHLELPSEGPGGHGTDGAALLRRTAAGLCAECHDSKTAGVVLQHALYLGRAHETDRSSRLPGGSGLDPESRACLACHDGSAAAVAEVFEWGFGARRARGFDLFSQHPIGVVYDDAPRGRQPSGLKPRASLPAAVTLVGGKVSCVSCHSLYSGLPGMLSLPGRRDRLCLACHVK